MKTDTEYTRTEEIQAGHKTIYLFFGADGTAKAMVDCDIYAQLAHVEVPMTCQQAEELIVRSLHRAEGKHVQEIFPELDKSLREIFVSGTTPAEWDENMNGERMHWRFYAEKRFYKFDHNLADPEFMDEVDDRHERARE